MSVDHATLPADNATLPPLAATTEVPSFTALHLPRALVNLLTRQQISIPTPVQAAVIPDALAGKDVLGRARTGSGKTLAFGLPMLVRLSGRRSKPRHPRGLIILPTRELAIQVRKSLEPLADAVRLRMVTVYGGTPYDRQIRRLQQGADIVVATPGRLEDLMRRGSCNLDHVEVTVLDEADHLCDLGFFPVVSSILSKTPKGSQRLLLSATLDGDVDALVRRHLPVNTRHDVDSVRDIPTTMDHHVLVVGQSAKVDATTALLEANPRSIVFTRTRGGATNLARALSRNGVDAVDLHGNLSQRARERNLTKFRNGSAKVVVATDVAARGIHVESVGLVVHYDVPDASKSYLHRSGRTARAGKSGAVVTVSTPPQIGQVVRMHKIAGVEARHHDMRTAPRPLTAAALATSGESAPSAGSGRGFVTSPPTNRTRRPSRRPRSTRSRRS